MPQKPEEKIWIPATHESAGHFVGDESRLQVLEVELGKAKDKIREYEAALASGSKREAEMFGELIGLRALRDNLYKILGEKSSL